MVENEELCFMSENPFATKNQVKPPKYAERHNGVLESDLINGLINKNMSYLIIGESFSGKSSILNFINPSDCSKHSEWLNSKYYGNKEKKFLFSFLIFPQQGFNTKEEIWRTLFSPLRNKLDDDLKEKYDSCLNKGNLNHKSEEWNKIFSNLSGFKLIILIDEFEMLLTKKEFNALEFVCTLRGFVDYECISVVITARRPKNLLYNLMYLGLNQEDRPAMLASPCLNKFEELYLGALDNTSANSLLNKSGCFDPRELIFLKEFSGCYPGIIHYGAHFLWEDYKKFPSKSTSDRILYTAKIMQDITREIFWNAWDNWPIEFKKAITYIALTQSIVISKKNKLFSSAINHAQVKADFIDTSIKIEDYEYLEKIGFIKINEDFYNNPIERGKEYVRYEIKVASILYELIDKAKQSDIKDQIDDARYQYLVGIKIPFLRGKIINTLVNIWNPVFSKKDNLSLFLSALGIVI